MNEVQKRIYEKVVQPAVRNIAGLVIGTLRDYNPVTNLAVVAYTTTTELGGQERVATHVPVCHEDGMKSSGPFVGDPVLLGFIGNNYSSPIVIKVLDVEFMIQTRPLKMDHFRRGSNTTDLYPERTKEFWEEEDFFGEG